MATFYTGRQAIQTHYHGPTDTKGTRISAGCEADRIFVPYDHALDRGGNHAEAAQTLATKLGGNMPGEKLVGGVLPNGDFAWVFVSKED